MSEVTEILAKIESGQAESKDLLPLVYDELRKLAAARMASERSDHTLQPTALVHEAYVRLVDSARSQNWDHRGHFFAAAAQAMRRILIESARAKQSLKRGGDRQRVDLHDYCDSRIDSPDLLLDLDDGLQRLAAEDADTAALVELRLFAGLSVKEAGEMLGMARSTAYENWEFARSWFAVYLDSSPD